MSSDSKQLELLTPKPISKRQLPKLLKFSTFEEDEILKLSTSDINSNLTKIFIEYSNNEEKLITIEEFKQIFNIDDQDKLSNLNFLYLIADQKNEGKLNLSDWINFSKKMLFLNNNYELNYKHLKIASIKNIELENDDEFKFVFQIFKLLENRVIDHSSNITENSISKLNFFSIIRLFDPTTMDKIQSYYNTSSDLSNDTLLYKDFIQVVQDLSIINFNYDFKKLNKDAISVEEFKTILNDKIFSKNQIPKPVLDKIDDLLPYFFTRSVTSAPNQPQLNYQQCLLIINFLQNLPKFNYLLINNIYQTGTTSNNLISVDQFYRYVNDYNNLFPHLQSLTELDEIDLYFYWNSIILNDHLKNAKTSKDFINKLEVLTLLSDFDMSGKKIKAGEITGEVPKTGGSFVDRFRNLQFFHSIHSFLLGSIAGAFGATMVYPIDLVKTRMQLQRQVKLYSGYLDCFVKVFKMEGLRGFYRGIIPQWIGVAPEKLIKLTVNDLVRKIGADERGRVSVPWELLAGCSAGAAQVVFTNPLEIVKIRLQVLGESQVQASLFQIINKLGLRGLYKGATLCLLRDVPFSAIYFPTYANLKKYLFNFDPTDPSKVQHLSSLQLLVSGALAGIPLLYLTTPFDVLKTRLQVETKQHETKYLGMRHCAQTILKEEGFKLFFKGGIARIMRSSPQFGFTLLSYEFLQTQFSIDKIFGPVENGGGKRKRHSYNRRDGESLSAEDENDSLSVINPSKISNLTGNTEFTKLKKFNYYGIGNNNFTKVQSDPIMINTEIKDYSYGLESLLQFRLLKNYDKINKICNNFNIDFKKIDYMDFLNSSSKRIQ